MWTPDYFVRYINFPPAVEGVTVPNSDGSFDIYINEGLCEEKRKEKIQHELRHIRRDHFYKDGRSVESLELEAEPQTIAEQAANGEIIPLFASLGSLKKWYQWHGDLA